MTPLILFAEVTGFFVLAILQEYMDIWFSVHSKQGNGSFSRGDSGIHVKFGAADRNL